MKITQKHLRILAGFCVLLGVVIYLLTKYLAQKNLEEPNSISKWIGIGMMIVGLILNMPWLEKKDKELSLIHI